MWTKSGYTSFHFISSLKMNFLVHPVPVSTFVVVGHGTALAAPAVVAVALGVQAGAVHAPPTSRVQAVV